MFFKKRTTGLCYLLTYAIFCCGGCSRWDAGGLFSNGKPSVSVEKVLVEEKQATLSIAATLQPSEKVEILFPIDVKIDHVLVNLGDNVKQGDLLFVLSDQDFNLKLNQLKAQRMEQEAQLEKNRYFFNNRDRLLEEGKIDKAVHDALETEVKANETQVERLKADIAVLENQVQHLNVTSPTAGIVTVKNIANGTTIPARQILLTIVKPDPIYVGFTLSAADSKAVASGMTIHVHVENFGDQNFPAQVIFVNPEVTSADHTFDVKASLANPKLAFKGGMQAQVSFISPEKSKVVSISTKAVLSDNNKEYVYVVRQNRAWRVRVYTRKSADNPNLIEIMEGIGDGEMVVTDGQDKLKEGAEVNLWR